jgi:hypothetical protein
MVKREHSFLSVPSKAQFFIPPKIKKNLRKHLFHSILLHYLYSFHSIFFFPFHFFIICSFHSILLRLCLVGKKGGEKRGKKMVFTLIKNIKIKRTGGTRRFSFRPTFCFSPKSGEN